MNVAALPLTEKLSIVLKKAAVKLPAEVGNQLLALITPQALAIMAGVVTAWAVSHFFGIGFIADLVLLIAGVVALGGIAWTAGSHLIDFATTTYSAISEKELNEAADHLAKAVTLIGVGAVAALLLKKKPGDTLAINTGHKLPTYRQYKNATPTLQAGFYKPTIKFTSRLPVKRGETNARGDILIGRNFIKLPNRPGLDNAKLMVLETVYHERIHQLLTPKYYLLRELRTHLNAGAYHRSYLMRYLTEVLAETYAILRVHGLDNKYIIESLKLPLNGQYNITFSLLRGETVGVLLGPVNVVGMVYNAFYGVSTYGR